MKVWIAFFFCWWEWVDGKIRVGRKCFSSSKRSRKRWGQFIYWPLKHFHDLRTRWKEWPEETVVKLSICDCCSSASKNTNSFVCLHPPVPFLILYFRVLATPTQGSWQEHWTQEAPPTRNKPLPCLVRSNAFNGHLSVAIPNYRIPRNIYSHPQLTLSPPFSVGLSGWRVLEMALHQIFNGPRCGQSDGMIRPWDLSDATCRNQTLWSMDATAVVDVTRQAFQTAWSNHQEWLSSKGSIHSTALRRWMILLLIRLRLRDYSDFKPVAFLHADHLSGIIKESKETSLFIWSALLLATKLRRKPVGLLPLWYSK